MSDVGLILVGLIIVATVVYLYASLIRAIRAIRDEMRKDRIEQKLDGKQPGRETLGVNYEVAPRK